MNDFEKDMVEDLVALGAIEIAFVDPETGESLYKITSKARDLIPSLYDTLMKETNRSVMKLWEKGYVEIDLFSDDPNVTLTKKGKNARNLSDLSIEEQVCIKEIRKILA